MTIDEAIRHCEEVAEKKDEDAAEYARLAEKLESTYEKLPAVIENARCVQCSADHRQLAEWLRELKKAKRLLSSLLSDTNDGSCTKSCYGCKHWDPERGCDYSARYEWKHTDEVIKLIGGDDECI